MRRSWSCGNWKIFLNIYLVIIELILFSIQFCNLPKFCCVLVGPGDNGVVEFPAPMHISLSWHQLKGIPQLFNTKMWFKLLEGSGEMSVLSQMRDHSFICTSRQMYFFTNWQGCFGKQENANNKKCLKTMTTESVIKYVLLESYCHIGPIAK